MFLKLLKNDLKAVFKYWWIGAVASLGISFLGGFCINLISDNIESFRAALAGALGIMAAVAVFVAFVILTVVLVFIRYYKNFFSDEGYLTFTLPVKRKQLLDSKILAAAIAAAATFACLFASIFNMALIGFMDDSEFWEFEYIEEVATVNIYDFIYLVESFLLICAIVLFVILLMFVCITFASVIARKARVIASIGIFYGATSIISFFYQVVYYFGLYWIYELFDALPEGQADMFIALSLFVIILFIAALCVALYTLALWMIDRKLNLS